MIYKILLVDLILGVALSLSTSKYYSNDKENINDVTKIPANVTTKLRIFYETLCPGSKDFFVRELRPTLLYLSPYLDLHLVPYGIAKTSNVSGRYEFQCHHGPRECYGNRLHACVLDAVNSTVEAVYINMCLIQHNTFSFRVAIKVCIYNFNYIKAILDCMSDERSNNLLKKHGDETMALRPHYVPFADLQAPEGNRIEVTRDLITSVCEVLEFKPLPCHFYSFHRLLKS